MSLFWRISAQLRGIQPKTNLIHIFPFYNKLIQQNWEGQRHRYNIISNCYYANQIKFILCYQCCNHAHFYLKRRYIYIKLVPNEKPFPLTFLAWVFLIGLVSGNKRIKKRLTSQEIRESCIHLGFKHGT